MAPPTAVVEVVVMPIVPTVLKVADAHRVIKPVIQFVLIVAIILVAVVVLDQAVQHNARMVIIILVVQHAMAHVLTIVTKNVQKGVLAVVKEDVEVVVSQLAMMVVILNVIGQEDLVAVADVYLHVKTTVAIPVIGIAILKYKVK